MIEVHIASGQEAAGEASDRGDVIVLIDALRATTTIITALAEGVRQVRAVAKAEDCTGELTAGERMGAKLPGMDLDNSPLGFLDRKHEGKSLTLTTTNGTRCMEWAARNPEAIVLLGAFVNLSSAASDARRLAEYYDKNISVIACGRLREESVEDNLTADLIAKAIRESTATPPSPEQHLKLFEQGSSGLNLQKLGQHQDIAFCAQQDIYELTPILLNGVCRALMATEPPFAD